ncbi:MAG: DUF748 domain-containing protein, partial [Rhodocyclaceae bacterium]
MVGEVLGKATRLAVVRGKDGHFNAEQFAAAGDAPAAKTSAAPARKHAAVPAKKAPAGPDWQVSVKHVALDDWGVRLEDQTLSPSIVFNAEPLAIKVDGLSTAKGSKARVDLRAAINKRGKIGVAGTVGLAPLA